MSKAYTDLKNDSGRLSKEDFKTSVIILRLKEKDKLAMTTKAKEKGLTLSEFLRFAGLKESKRS